MRWSASQYTRFEHERNRPVYDLLARIPAASVTRAVDLGCGPGNSTQLLQQHCPQARITGIDNSANMLEAARKRLPATRFLLADIATWREPGPFDLIFSNAALQWVPDHSSLLPSLLAKLAPGGTLAVQIPDNLEEPAHRLMRAIAAEGPWSSQLAATSAARSERHSPEWYFETLRAHAPQVDVWRTTYYHALPDASAVVEWFKGTGLRPFLDPLDPAQQAAFLERYRDAIAQAYPPLADGLVVLPFPRLFFTANV